MLPSSTGQLEENDNFVAEQRNYGDYDEPVSLSVLRRLDKQFQDIMLTVHKVWGPKLVEMEGRIMKLELAVDKLLASMNSNDKHNRHNSRQRCLYLQFSHQVSRPIWTGDEIKGRGGDHIQIVLVDETGKVVDFGPEASAEVKVAALKGDADDNWGDATKSGYFTDDIAGNQKAKKPFLTGDVQLKLNKGIGILVNIKFRNSSRHMSGAFKLEARVVDVFDGTFIKDARTEPFMVKDYRGKYNGKHHPPSLSDDICHLHNIGRSVSRRLRQQGINTVEDFLIQHLKDSDRLKHVVRHPPKKWEDTVKHAVTCQLDEKLYCSFNSEENKGVVFNAVGKVLGLILQLKYVRFENLPDEAKVDASKMEIAKIVQKDGLVAFDNEASLLQHYSQPITALHPSNNSRLDNTIDYENGESHQMNFIDSLEDIASPSNVTGVTCLNILHDFTRDQQFIDLESLWPDSDNNQTVSIDDMLAESPDVDDCEVKKKLFLLFTVSKWLLQLEKMTACEGNDNQKRRRIEMV